MKNFTQLLNPGTAAIDQSPVFFVPGIFGDVFEANSLLQCYQQECQESKITERPFILVGAKGLVERPSEPGEFYHEPKTMGEQSAYLREILEVPAAIPEDMRGVIRSLEGRDCPTHFPHEAIRVIGSSFGVYQLADVIPSLKVPVEHFSIWDAPVPTSPIPNPSTLKLVLDELLRRMPNIDEIIERFIEGDARTMGYKRKYGISDFSYEPSGTISVDGENPIFKPRYEAAFSGESGTRFSGFELALMVSKIKQHIISMNQTVCDLMAKIPPEHADELAFLKGLLSVITEFHRLTVVVDHRLHCIQDWVGKPNLHSPSKMELSLGLGTHSSASGPTQHPVEVVIFASGIVDSTSESPSCTDPVATLGWSQTQTVIPKQVVALPTNDHRIVLTQAVLSGVFQEGKLCFAVLLEEVQSDTASVRLEAEAGELLEHPELGPLLRNKVELELRSKLLDSLLQAMADKLNEGSDTTRALMALLTDKVNPKGSAHEGSITSENLRRVFEDLEGEIEHHSAERPSTEEKADTHAPESFLAPNISPEYGAILENV